MKHIFLSLFLFSANSFADIGNIYQCQSDDGEWSFVAKIVPSGIVATGFITGIGPDFQMVTGDFNRTLDTSGGRIFSGSTSLKKPISFEEKLGSYSFQFSGKKLWLECEVSRQEIQMKNCQTWFCSRGGPIPRYIKVVAESSCPSEQKPQCI